VKKVIFFLIFTLLLFNVTLSEKIKYSNPKLELISINPSYPKNEDIMDVKLRVINEGTGSANFTIVFIDNKFFQLITQNYKTVSLLPYDYRDVDFYFKVTNATTGKYPLIFRVKTSSFYRDFVFFVNVRNPTELSLISKTEGCLINSKCNYSFELKNLGFGSCKNIAIHFSLPSKEVIIKELKPGAEKNLTVNLFISKNVKTGLNNLLINLECLDDNNQIKKYTFEKSLNIKDNVNLEVSSVIYDKDENAIKIKIENPGYGKARDIKLIVKTLNESRTFLIGSLDDDEDTTVYYYLDKKVSGFVPLNLKLEWFDNKKEEKEINASVFIRKKEDNNNIIILLALGVVFFGLIGYYLLKKNKKVSEEDEE